MIEVNKLIEHSEAFGEGMKKGKEMAIKNYDKLFLELYQKMEEIEYKLDCFISGFKKFGKVQKTDDGLEQSEPSRRKQVIGEIDKDYAPSKKVVTK